MFDQLERYPYPYRGAWGVSLRAARMAPRYGYLNCETVVKLGLRAEGPQTEFDDSFAVEVPVPRGYPGSPEAHIPGPAKLVWVPLKS